MVRLRKALTHPTRTCDCFSRASIRLVCDDGTMLSNWIIFSALVSLALFVLPFKMPRLEYVMMRHPKSLLRVFLKEARWKRGGSN